MSVSGQSLPLVVSYLYVTAYGETLAPHPSVRSSSPVRYLECALTQAASLRLQGACCDLVLATNIGDGRALGRTAVELLATLRDFGVELLPTEFRQRSGDGSRTYSSARFGRDAILSASEGQAAERQLWLTDLDCVWVNPELVLSAAPAAGEVGCVHIEYPPDWAVVGFGEIAVTPRAVGELAGSMGGSADVPPWVGGDLLSGTADTLRRLVGECDQLDAQLLDEDRPLSTEQQILSLVGALGMADFRDLSHVARRIHTGPRHGAVAPENPSALGLWHLPAEKGLSLRRAAAAVQRGRTSRLRRDLTDPARAARRFNLPSTDPWRRVRDDSWIAVQRIRGALRSRLGSS